jgi:hypothetical protein
MFWSPVTQRILEHVTSWTVGPGRSEITISLGGRPLCFRQPRKYLHSLLQGGSIVKRHPFPINISIIRHPPSISYEYLPCTSKTRLWLMQMWLLDDFVISQLNHAIQEFAATLWQSRPSLVHQRILDIHLPLTPWYFSSVQRRPKKSKKYLNTTCSIGNHALYNIPKSISHPSYRRCHLGPQTGIRIFEALTVSKVYPITSSGQSKRLMIFLFQIWKAWLRLHLWIDQSDPARVNGPDVGLMFCTWSSGWHKPYLFLDRVTIQ